MLSFNLFFSCLTQVSIFSTDSKSITAFNNSFIGFLHFFSALKRNRFKASCPFKFEAWLALFSSSNKGFQHSFFFSFFNA